MKQILEQVNDWSIENVEELISALRVVVQALKEDGQQ